MQCDHFGNDKIAVQMSVEQRMHEQLKDQIVLLKHGNRLDFGLNKKRKLFFKI